MRVTQATRGDYLSTADERNCILRAPRLVHKPRWNSQKSGDDVQLEELKPLDTVCPQLGHQAAPSRDSLRAQKHPTELVQLMQPDLDTVDKCDEQK